MDKTFRELKFLREKHTPEYKEFLKSCEEIDMAPLPVAFPKLARFFRADGVLFQQIMLRGYYNSRHFEAQKDDVFVVSFPKTGTSWMQEIVYLIGNEANLEKAKANNLEKRFPHLEYPYIDHEKYDEPKHRSIRPNFYKSHLPYSLLPKSVHQQNCKIIYITRNPKDTVVSYWKFYKMLKPVSYRGSLDEFLNLFFNDQIVFAPFAKNVIEFWDRRFEPNVLFLSYEDVTQDVRKYVIKIAEFLGRELSQEQLDAICRHCNFAEMSKNAQANYSHWRKNGMMRKGKKFLRKGQVGNWKKYMTGAMDAKIDDWVRREFDGTGVTFTYEL